MIMILREYEFTPKTRRPRHPNARRSRIISLKSIAGLFCPCPHLGQVVSPVAQNEGPQFAERKLADFRRAKQCVDPNLGKTTLAELCDRYAETLSHLSRSSIKSKTGIFKRIKTEWPAGSQ